MRNRKNFIIFTSLLTCLGMQGSGSDFKYYIYVQADAGKLTLKDVEKAIELRVNFDTFQDTQGNTLLATAIKRKNNIDAIQKMLEAGASPKNHFFTGKVPLVWLAFPVGGVNTEYQYKVGRLLLQFDGIPDGLSSMSIEKVNLFIDEINRRVDRKNKRVLAIYAELLDQGYVNNTVFDAIRATLPKPFEHVEQVYSRRATEKEKAVKTMQRVWRRNKAAKTVSKAAKAVEAE